MRNPLWIITAALTVLMLASCSDPTGPASSSPSAPVVSGEEPTETLVATPLATTASSTVAAATSTSVPTTPSAPTAPAAPTSIPTTPQGSQPSQQPAPPVRVQFREPGRNHAIGTTLYDNGMLPLTVNSRQIVAKSWGVVSHPTDTTGPFPLVIVLHGAHSFCGPPDSPRAWPCARGAEERNHDGLSYLTVALARQGFVAIAPGINEEYAAPGGAPGEVTKAIVERDVLTRLRSGAALATVSATQVDLSAVAVVGHSRGAAIAGAFGLAGDVRQLSVPVVGTVLIAPTTDLIDPELLADVPAAVIIGSCDGDTGVDGGDYLTTVSATLRRTPLALVLFDGATHNGTNSLLGADAAVDGRAGCQPPLDPRLQQDALATELPEILRSLVGLEANRPTGTRLFDRTRANDVIGGGVRIVHLDPTQLVTPLVAMSSLSPVTNSLVETSGLVATQCPRGSAGQSASAPAVCHRIDLPDLVGRPASTHLGWDRNASSVLRLPTPPTSAESVLVLRAFADPLDNATTPSKIISLTGREQSGATVWSATVEIPVPAVGGPVTGAALHRGTILWSETRLRVPAGVTTFELRPDTTQSGSIDLLSVELVDPPR